MHLIQGLIFLKQQWHNFSNYYDYQFSLKKILSGYLVWVCTEKKPATRRQMCDETNPHSWGVPDCTDYKNQAWSCLRDWRLSLSGGRIVFCFFIIGPSEILKHHRYMASIGLRGALNWSPLNARFSENEPMQMVPGWGQQSVIWQ